MLEAAALILGYLLGALPTAYIAGRWKKGMDIRNMGGGNMGALNATRELGLPVGIVVLLVDIAKGAGTVLAAEALGLKPVWVYLAGSAAVIGHCWPVYLKFRGGKGAATAAGVLLALAPLPVVCAVPLVIIVVLFTSNITLGTAAGLIGVFIFLWVFHRPSDLKLFSAALSLFLAIRYTSTGYRNYKKTGSFKKFLIDRDYKPWQSRRK
jgi:acyl phosphate:glycerol-3-phosphate acyltransferase